MSFKRNYSCTNNTVNVTGHYNCTNNTANVVDFKDIIVAQIRDQQVTQD